MVKIPIKLTDEEKIARKYSGLGLAEGENVISDVVRHPLGRVRIWAGIILVSAFFLFIAYLFYFVIDNFENIGGYAALICVVIALLVPLAGTILVRDYDEDWMVVTNFRLIQNIRHTAFANENQEIGLDGVEDISFHQTNMLQKIFDYGSIRLSTIGDEHTYTFEWVNHPASQVKAIRQAVTTYHEQHLTGKHPSQHSTY